MKIGNIKEKLLTLMPQRKEKKPDPLALQKEFINFLAYFNAFVSAGKNVYQALAAARDALRGEVQSYVAELVRAMEDDKSAKPYLDFARRFQNETITQIVTMIYQLSLNGEGIDEITGTLPLLERLKNMTIEAYIRKEGDNLNGYLMTPLVGVTAVSIFFSIGVLQNITAVF